MNFSAALFAGGCSSRMGRDKAFLEIGGIPLWRRQLQTLRELSPAEIFVAARERTEWMEADLEFVADAAPGGSPLAGLVATLRRCRTSHLLVLAIDLPRMTPEFFRRLLGMCFDDTGLVPRRNTCPTLFEPLAAIYPKCCLQLAENFLESARYALQPFVERGVREEWLTTRDIDQSEESLFFNINTPADFATTRRNETLPLDNRRSLSGRNVCRQSGSPGRGGTRSKFASKARALRY